MYDGCGQPNEPELSCGDVQRRRGSHSARGMSSPIVAGCFARAKSSTAGSVSLSDWLGGFAYGTDSICETCFRYGSFRPVYVACVLLKNPWCCDDRIRGRARRK